MAERDALDELLGEQGSRSMDWAESYQTYSRNPEARPPWLRQLISEEVQSAVKLERRGWLLLVGGALVLFVINLLSR